MRLLTQIPCCVLFFLFSSSAVAGVMEVGATYSTRESRIDNDNYSLSDSWTGSFSWYFLELSAIELSYTKAKGTLSAKSSTDPEAIVYIQEAELCADLVITFATRESLIQPFIKGGVAMLKKRIYQQLADNTLSIKSETDGFQTVPSYGVGLKINITKTLSLKGSFDRWRSASDQESDIWDEAVRAGVSWMF